MSLRDRVIDIYHNLLAQQESGDDFHVEYNEIDDILEFFPNNYYLIRDIMKRYRMIEYLHDLDGIEQSLGPDHPDIRECGDDIQNYIEIVAVLTERVCKKIINLLSA